MCPVAPKTSHTFGCAGFDEDGGSVVYGRDSLLRFVFAEWEERRVLGDGGFSRDTLGLISSILEKDWQ